MVKKCCTLELIIFSHRNLFSKMLCIRHDDVMDDKNHILSN